MGNPRVDAAALQRAQLGEVAARYAAMSSMRSAKPDPGDGFAPRRVVEKPPEPPAPLPRSLRPGSTFDTYA